MGDQALRLPISVKGVVFRDGQVLLLKNERDEWELPGGKLEIHETPQECAKREIMEEIGWDVTVRDLLDVWVYAISAAAVVLVISYGCDLNAGAGPLVSPEGAEAGLFSVRDVDGLRMPDEYRQSIRRWHDRLSFEL